MSSALFVREHVTLSDATEQLLLTFARHSGLRSGDTLIVAAATMNAASDAARSPGPNQIVSIGAIAMIGTVWKRTAYG